MYFIYIWRPPKTFTWNFLRNSNMFFNHIYLKIWNDTKNITTNTVRIQLCKVTYFTWSFSLSCSPLLIFLEKLWFEKPIGFCHHLLSLRTNSKHPKHLRAMLIKDSRSYWKKSLSLVFLRQKWFYKKVLINFHSKIGRTKIEKEKTKFT